MGRAQTPAQSPADMSKYELWKQTIDAALMDPAWLDYDCDIQRIVNTFNRHLTSAGYRSLDWKLVKSVVWTESGGPKAPSWKGRAMQIGNPGDAGLSALLSGKEGGELIMPAPLRQRLTASSAISSPQSNIEAGTAYLLMRHASFEVRSTLDDADSNWYTVIVKTGDSLDKIARNNGTTVEVLESNNVNVKVLHAGQVLKYRKAAWRKFISKWVPITTASIASRYNAHDPKYSQKLDYCLAVMGRSTVPAKKCAF